MSQTRCYLGLGSNLNDPFSQLQQALQALEAVPGIRVSTVSAFYRSLPIGPGEQPDYCNAVAEISTHLNPVDLLHSLQNIERAQGRDRKTGPRWSARTLDIDVLLYGDAIIDLDHLTVPHPEMADRNFVLVPLADIAPDLEVPGLGVVRVLAESAGCEGLQRWDESPA